MWTLSEGHQRKREISRYAFSFFHQRGTYFFFLYCYRLYFFFFNLFIVLYLLCFFLGVSAADNVIAVHFILIIRFSFLIDE